MTCAKNKASQATQTSRHAGQRQPQAAKPASPVTPKIFSRRECHDIERAARKTALQITVQVLQYADAFKASRSILQPSGPYANRDRVNPDGEFVRGLIDPFMAMLHVALPLFQGRFADQLREAVTSDLRSESGFRLRHLPPELSSFSANVPDIAEHSLMSFHMAAYQQGARLALLLLRSAMGFHISRLKYHPKHDLDRNPFHPGREFIMGVLDVLVPMMWDTRSLLRDKLTLAQEKAIVESLLDQAEAMALELTEKPENYMPGAAY